MRAGLQTLSKRFSKTALGLVVVFLFFGAPHPTPAEPLRVVTTTPDLADLVREVGGDQITVTSLVRGQQDAHFIEAKPSFIKQLSLTDLVVAVGLDLEIGWLPVLLQNARNSKILPGAQGYLDASVAIEPKDVPSGIVTRSMGDVHALGNPHYLLDPINGVRVAALIRDRLFQMDPAGETLIANNFKVFQDKLVEKMFGKQAAIALSPEKLFEIAERAELRQLLANKNIDYSASWLGKLDKFGNKRLVTDHRLWTYFAQRFDLEILGELEDKPGIPPSNRHLEELIGLMRSQNVRAILAAPYFDLRTIEFVAERTQSTVITGAHQVGSRPGTETYLKMIDYNVSRVAESLSAR